MHGVQGLHHRPERGGVRVKRASQKRSFPVFSGARLRAAREKMLMSQEGLAAAIHASLATLRNYEADRTIPTASRAAQIAQLLECDLNSLYEEDR